MKYDPFKELDTTRQKTKDEFTGWYTLDQLEAAFNKVCNKNDWKGPINAYCLDSEMDIVYQAVIYYTSTVPKFWCTGRTDLRHVVADGYRMGPAGP